MYTILSGSIIAGLMKHIRRLQRNGRFSVFIFIGATLYLSPSILSLHLTVQFFIFYFFLVTIFGVFLLFSFCIERQNGNFFNQKKESNTIAPKAMRLHVCNIATNNDSPYRYN
jgi:hypothetical protein